MKKSEILLGLARIPVDFGMAMLAFIIAYHIRQNTDLIPGLYFPIDQLSFPNLQEYLILASMASIALITIFAINQMYTLRNTARIGNELLKVLFLSAAWLMLIIAYYFVTREFFFSRLVLGYAWILTMILVSCGRILIRIFQRYLAKLGIGKRRVLFLGGNILTQRIAKKFKTIPSYKIIGYLSSKKTKKLEGLRHIGTIKDLEDIVQRRKIEEIVQTQSDLSEARAHEIVDFCREHHIKYHFVPDILQVHRTQVDVFNISGLPLISLKTTPLDGWGKVIKRLVDLILSCLLLILLLPLFILIAIGIKIDSKGPILFTQKDNGEQVQRVGFQGRRFNFYKFRTMRNKTDNLRYTKLADQDHRKDSPLVKIKNDPRVTRFGKLLRRWSLDELPQLWSVFKGDMSLISPRAHLPEEVAKYQKHHKFLLSIKPGITGLAQVNGRSDLDFEKEVRLDTYYIENWSLLLDLKILFQTIFVVLGGKGAD
jgi:exopolysaccharide biosynthesis polyprenyl glycosylphosphotransferase